MGALGLIDDDVVGLSNLQRQIAFSTSEVGRPKVQAAADRLTGLNPHVVIEAHPERLTEDNAAERIGAYDLVLDGTDDFQTRLWVNAACVATGRPLVSGALGPLERTGRGVRGPTLLSLPGSRNPAGRRDLRPGWG